MGLSPLCRWHSTTTSAQQAPPGTPPGFAVMACAVLQCVLRQISQKTGSGGGAGTLTFSAMRILQLLLMQVHSIEQFAALHQCKEQYWALRHAFLAFLPAPHPYKAEFHVADSPHPSKCARVVDEEHQGA